MEILESKAKQGSQLIIHPSVRLKGLSIGLSLEGGGSGLFIEEYSIKKALKSFEKSYFIKMPNISSELKINKFLNLFLKKGYKIDNSILETNLIFEFEKEKELYFSKLIIENSAWIDYVREHGPFPRELIVGINKNNFTQSYLDMGKSIKNFQSQPL